MSRQSGFRGWSGLLKSISMERRRDPYVKFEIQDDPHSMRIEPGLIDGGRQ
jgi:hypothetical protein